MQRRPQIVPVISAILALALSGAVIGKTPKLPAELADRKLPLDSLRRDLAGSRLDKPRAYVSLYGSGRLMAEAWGEGPELDEALNDAWSKARQQKPAGASHAMLVIPTGRQAVASNAIRRTFSTAHRGVLGALVESESGSFLLSPTQVIANNRSVDLELKAEAKRRGVEYKSWLENSRVFSLAARQFFVPLASSGPAVETLRGNVLVETGDITQAAVQRFEGLLTDWMFNNLAADGRLTYLYLPSSGREGRGNNMIRQWMGSVALGRAARIHPDARRAQASLENIRYNLRQYYRKDGELGYIEYDNEVKLGAAALALMAIVESPRRAEFADYERGLLATTRHLWQPSGRFHTFLEPPRRRDENQNFYPGEALLAWSLLYAQKPDPDLLDKSLKSFAHYRTWHLQNRNPAFIPWHTQAYYQLYLKTRDDSLSRWIFEMNDWLVEVMQTRSRVAYDDTFGQFYEGSSDRFGPPHASSTGAYLEGLVDAFTLARSVGDQARREKYRKSIILGLRSSIQLQFQDDIDMYYAGQHERLRGGLRTTVYDNRVRVDNVQHVLMAVQKIQKEFTPEDFRYPE